MNGWEVYKSRILKAGGTRRNASLLREKRFLNNKVPNSLSYHRVLIDGEERSVSIINSDNLSEKKMLSLPGEDFACGSVVEWANNRWLITEKDANVELYSRVFLVQCNYLLKWIDEEGVIHEQWCVIEDGTKYLTGEYEDRHFIVTRGDSRIAMTIGRNEHTSKFSRKSRFIIDDENSPQKLAYALTKPLKIGHTYNDMGVFKFVLQEVVTTDNDNLEEMVADYYKFINDDETGGDDVVGDEPENNEGGGENPPSTGGAEEGAEPENDLDDDGKESWL